MLRKAERRKKCYIAGNYMGTSVKVASTSTANHYPQLSSQSGIYRSVRDLTKT